MRNGGLWSGNFGQKARGTGITSPKISLFGQLLRGKLIIDLIPFSISFLRLQKETPSDVQLHMAAMRGDEVALLRVLDSGKVHVDCKDEVSYKKHLNQFMQLHDFQLYKVG